jgi:hypothetical protein
MPRRNPKCPEDPQLIARRQQRMDLERICREAAENARGKLRSLKESVPHYPGSNVKIPVSEITLSMVSMASVAAPFERRLQACHSSVHALQQRLCNWARSGNRDIIVERGRPPTKALTPTKKLAIKRAIDGNRVGNMSAAQVAPLARCAAAIRLTLVQGQRCVQQSHRLEVENWRQEARKVAAQELANGWSCSSGLNAYGANVAARCKQQRAHVQTLR